MRESYILNTREFQLIKTALEEAKEVITTQNGGDCPVSILDAVALIGPTAPSQEDEKVFNDDYMEMLEAFREKVQFFINVQQSRTDPTESQGVTEDCQAGWMEDCQAGWHVGNEHEDSAGVCSGHDEDGKCYCECHQEKEEE